jgi:hypothetical protein
MRVEKPEGLGPVGFPNLFYYQQYCGSFNVTALVILSISPSKMKKKTWDTICVAR